MAWTLRANGFPGPVAAELIRQAQLVDDLSAAEIAERAQALQLIGNALAGYPPDAAVSVMALSDAANVVEPDANALGIIIKSIDGFLTV